jgi:hypothetical protein
MGIETQELKNKVVKNQGPKMCLTLKKKNKDLISSKMLSWSSKLMSFLSLQRYYKRHKGTIFQTTLLVGPAIHQQSYKLTTRLGILKEYYW